MTQLQGEGLVAPLCALMGVSRAAYYRGWAERTPKAEETGLRDLVQRLALASGSTATGGSPSGCGAPAGW